MKKSNCSFFILQLLFTAAISSALILSACSRTNTGVDPSPPGGEIVFVYDIDLAIQGQGVDANYPLWWNEGSTIIEVKVTFKANPNQPVTGIPVDFTVSGGGDFYNFDTFKIVGRVARVLTNDVGIALVYYYTKGETEKRRFWEYDPDKGGYGWVEREVPQYDNQYVSACVDEANVGNQYDNCKSTIVYINGPPKE